MFVLVSTAEDETVKYLCGTSMNCFSGQVVTRTFSLVIAGCKTVTCMGEAPKVDP